MQGGLTSAGLLATVWWSWFGSTLHADRSDHDDLVHRLHQLASTAAVIGLAVSATEATVERFAVLVGCQLVLRLPLLLQHRRAYRHVAEARPVARQAPDPVRGPSLLVTAARASPPGWVRIPVERGPGVSETATFPR